MCLSSPTGFDRLDTARPRASLLPSPARVGPRPTPLHRQNLFPVVPLRAEVVVAVAAVLGVRGRRWGAAARRTARARSAWVPLRVPREGRHSTLHVPVAGPGTGAAVAGHVVLVTAGLPVQRGTTQVHGQHQSRPQDQPHLQQTPSISDYNAFTGICLYGLVSY